MYNRGLSVPLPCFIGLGIEEAPMYAKDVCWEGLEEWEREWFNRRFVGVSDFYGIKRYEWEMSLIRKLMTERDAIEFVHDRKRNKSFEDECEDLIEI